MTHDGSTIASQRPLRQDIWHAARYYLGSRTGLILSAAGVFGVAAYFNWGWLAALGLAPIIIALLPCAAMCALGLCMRGHARTGADDAGQSVATEAAGAEPLKLATSDASSETKKDSPQGRKGCC